MTTLEQYRKELDHIDESMIRLLEERMRTVEKIAEQIGFPDAKSFCRVFKKLTGISAGTYRKKRKQIRQSS